MNNTSGGDGIPTELFQILKDDAVKVLHSVYQQIWKTQQWQQDCKKSVFFPIQKKGDAKDCSNYCTIAVISQASKVMLKILHARLQQYTNRELPDVQAEKADEPEIKFPTSIGSSKKWESSRKNTYFFFIDYAKTFDCVNHNKCGKFLKRWKYQTIWPASWEICMHVKKQQLELDMEQQTDSK